MRRSPERRIDLELVHVARDPRARQQLGAFVYYCVARIERDLGPVAHWSVKVAPSHGGFATSIHVDDRGAVLDVQADAFDGPLAVWDAMCRIEQRLREERALPHSAHAK